MVIFEKTLIGRLNEAQHPVASAMFAKAEQKLEFSLAISEGGDPQELWADDYDIWTGEIIAHNIDALVNYLDLWNEAVSWAHDLLGEVLSPNAYDAVVDWINYADERIEHLASVATEARLEAKEAFEHTLQELNLEGEEYYALRRAMLIGYDQGTPLVEIISDMLDVQPKRYDKPIFSAYDVLDA